MEIKGYINLQVVSAKGYGYDRKENEVPLRVKRAKKQGRGRFIYRNWREPATGMGVLCHICLKAWMVAKRGLWVDRPSRGTVHYGIADRIRR